MSSYILNDINDINNSPNELLLRHTLNRNFEKLLQNDITLLNFKEELKNKNYKIAIFSENSTYDKNDIIWYKYNDDLYLLKSIIPNNSNIPTIDYENGDINFEKSGWKDLYEFGTYINNIDYNDISLSSSNTIVLYLILQYSNILFKEHLNSNELHNIGLLEKDTKDLENKFLKSDLSNIDANRITNFYPYETIMLKPDNTIIGGFYKKWHCGILEYDIIFLLGFTGEYEIIDFIKHKIIEANTLLLNDEKYYLTMSDADILNLQGDLTVNINKMHQIRLNKYSNTFSSVIYLPEPFIDDNYCIFGTSALSQMRNEQTRKISLGKNKLVFTNKYNDMLTPVYIILPDDYNKIGCLVTNQFTCKLIGRWK